jgi:hypothetical protein
MVTHIADGVILSLHPSQQDLSVPYGHRHHIPISQITGLRHFDEHALAHSSADWCTRLEAVALRRGKKGVAFIYTQQFPERGNPQ